jgi:mRNA interferase RelE/StbE
LSVKYRLIVEKRAAQFLTKQAPQLAAQLGANCELLIEDPRPPGCKRLRGNLAPLYRLRVGDYRIVYDVNDADREVRITNIGHRSRVYD